MSTKYIASNWRLPNQAGVDSYLNDNYGLSFNGTSSIINFGNITELQGATNASFSMWLNVDLTSTQALFQQWGTSTDRLIYSFINLSSGRIDVYVSPNISFRVTGNSIISSLSTGEWFNLVITYDGTQSTSTDRVKAYINNQELTGNTFGGPTSLYSSTTDFILGTRPSGTYFDGKMSEFSIFDYTLSESQISTLYGSSSLGAGNPLALKPAPVAFYPLGDNSSGNPLTQPNEAVEDASVFEFNQDGFIDLGTGLGNLLGDSYTDDLTFSAWIKVPASSNPQNGIFVMDSSGPPEFALLFLNNNQVWLEAGGNNIARFTSTGIDDDKWHHLVIVYDNNDATNTKLYFDNSSATKTTILSQPSSLNFNGDNTVIGTYFDSRTSFRMTAKLSNAQVWNTALSSSEVSTLYNSGVPLLTGTQPQASNLKAWYKLDQSANWEADSSGAWQIPDAVSAYPQSFNFVPNDYIEVSDSDSLSFGNGTTDLPFSISAWVNFDDVTNSIVLSKHTTGQFEYSFLVMSNDKLIFQLNSQLGSNLISRYYNTTITSYEGQWIHLVGTYDGSSSASGIKIYLNGTRVDDTDFTSGTYVAMSNGTAPVQIGRRLTNYMNGKISNAKIYNVELSSTQVETLYNNGTPLTTAIASDNLKAWYKLDNTATFSTNWSVPDASGNGNTGTSSGMTEQNLVNNNVSALNGDSNGMTSANLVLSNLTRAVPYDSYSFNFDSASSDYVSINTNSLGITTAICISSWIKTSSTSGAKAIISQSDRSSRGNWILLQKHNYIMFGVYHASGSTFIDTQAYGIVSDDIWHHIAATWDGTTNTNAMKIYIDGNVAKQGTASSTGIKETTDRTDFPRIGATYDNAEFFDGQISNVSVFNEALTSTEVLKLYSNGMPQDLSSFTPAPVAWWTLGSNSFFNGSNFICKDLIGSNDGTSVNAGVDALQGNTPRSEANGTGTNNSIPENLVGTTKYSSNNSWSINMSESARVQDTP